MSKTELVIERVTPQTTDYGCTPQGITTITTSVGIATNGAQPQKIATAATSVKPPARD